MGYWLAGIGRVWAEHKMWKPVLEQIARNP
jgi:hypothetical protein